MTFILEYHHSCSTPLQLGGGHSIPLAQISAVKYTCWSKPANSCTLYSQEQNVDQMQAAAPSDPHGGNSFSGSTEDYQTAKYSNHSAHRHCGTTTDDFLTFLYSIQQSLVHQTSAV